MGNKNVVHIDGTYLAQDVMPMYCFYLERRMSDFLEVPVTVVRERRNGVWFEGFDSLEDAEKAFAYAEEYMENLQ